MNVNMHPTADLGQNRTILCLEGAYVNKKRPETGFKITVHPMTTGFFS